MECAEAGEMFDYIVRNKHVEEKQACNFFHQIVDGVEVLHQNFITHRDLKPENLLLKDCGSGYLLKIVDFGLSNTHEVKQSFNFRPIIVFVYLSCILCMNREASCYQQHVDLHVMLLQK